jgi:iron complex transport system ATP-binding protein
MSSDKSYLRAEGVTVHHRGADRPALESIDFAAQAGKLVSLLGPNGSGKSTLLRVLAGIQTPTRGQAFLGEKVAHALPRDVAARRGAFVPQAATVAFDFTALEVALLGRHPFGRGLLLERAADLTRAERALARTGALEFRDRPFQRLSGGEKQRVLIARALAQDAPALLLDEPTSAQDLAHGLALFELFAKLAKDEGRTVVVATHDVNAAARHSDSVCVLERGRRIREGPPGEVLVPELLRSVFEVEPLVGKTPGGSPFFVALEPARREGKA